MFVLWDSLVARYGWRTILTPRCPTIFWQHSKLILKGDTFRFPEVRERFVKGFGERGIDPSRVELRLASSHAQLLAEYADVDIALDPFPYNGGATTCDALWMGVPVVTRQGDSMISRQSAAMLAALAMPELVARDDDAYLAIATRLAASLARLETLRGSLRHIMAASPLCDAERFSDAFMQRMRQAWREWCEHEHSS